MVCHAVDKGRESTLVAKHAAADNLKDLGKICVNAVLPKAVRMPQVFHIFGQVAKEEDVALTDLTGDFNLRKNCISKVLLLA